MTRDLYDRLHAIFNQSSSLLREALAPTLTQDPPACLRYEDALRLERDRRRLMLQAADLNDHYMALLQADQPTTPPPAPTMTTKQALDLLHTALVNVVTYGHHNDKTTDAIVAAAQAIHDLPD